MSTATNNNVCADTKMITILMVEDDPDLLAFTCQFLQRQGYKLLPAYEANEAIKQLKSAAPIDLIFTDVRLPGGMDGVSLALQAQQLRPGIKVLITSGFDQELLSKISPDEFVVLAKPYYPKELIQTISGLLQTNTEIST